MKHLRYFSMMHFDNEVKELTAEEAMDYLMSTYKKNEVKRLFKESISFRLITPYREIWTKDDQGRVPMAGFYGIIE